MDVGREMMYWIDESAKIWRAGLDGANIESLVEPTFAFLGVGSHRPFIAGWSIALDTVQRRMYWTDDGPRWLSRDRIGNLARISRADFDGSNVEVIHSFDSDMRELDIALDLRQAERRIYWGGDTIQRSGLDGSNVEDVYRHSERVRSIAIEER